MLNPTYSLAISVSRGRKYVVRAGATRDARSEEEAIGLGVKIAEKLYPINQGYHGHRCVAVEVTPADNILDQMTPKELVFVADVLDRNLLTSDPEVAVGHWLARQLRILAQKKE